MSEIGLTSPLLDISDFFEFQTYLKNADPLGSISDIFEFENKLMLEDPRTIILKGLFRHITLKRVKLRVLIFLS